MTTMMQVPPKQKLAITSFDLKTQREAFSVSLEGLKGVGYLSILVLHLCSPCTSGISIPLWPSHLKLVKTGRSGCVVFNKL